MATEGELHASKGQKSSHVEAARTHETVSKESRVHRSDPNREPVECELQSHQQLDQSNIWSTYRIYDVQISFLNVTQRIMLKDCIIFANSFFFSPYLLYCVTRLYMKCAHIFSLYLFFRRSAVYSISASVYETSHLGNKQVYFGKL
jgi:hypothetical protein